MRVNVIKIVGDGQVARLADRRTDDPGAVMGLDRLRNLMAIHLRRALR